MGISVEALKNQTIYQCSYCSQIRKKRFLSKNGCKLHEEKYCKHPDSPNQKRRKQKQLECEHKEKEMQYRYIPGEAVQEPDYELCLDCGKHL